MKLFLKRNQSDDELCFTVYDESGHEKYHIAVQTEKFRQKIDMNDTEERTVSEITHKFLVLRYYTVRCNGRFYVLVPQVKDCFFFMIYGSTYRFAGNLSEGSFSLFDVDTSPVMTQKKCWSRYGDSYELTVYQEQEEIFAVSCAICADMYLAITEEDAVLTG